MLNIRVLLIVLLLFAIYGLVIWGLTLALRRLAVSSEYRIIFSFLIFAAGAGLWATLAWPLDSMTLINFPATLFGDSLYQWSILHLGNPNSPQAHYTIPWFLRVPQVHFTASMILWGLFGLAMQLIRNRWRQIAVLFCYSQSAKTNEKGATP